MNTEFDYTIEEINAMKWMKTLGFDRGCRKHWLGDFDGDRHIAYNNIQILEYVKRSYSHREIIYEVTINADLYGEKGYSKTIKNSNLRAVKAHIKEVIEKAYAEGTWVFKKRNLE